VITPAIMLSPPGGDSGRSIDIIEAPRACREDRDPIVLDFSNSAPKYFESSLPFFLSFFPLLEKKDLPPDDCRDLSELDMTPKSPYRFTVVCIAEGAKSLGFGAVFRYHG